MIRRRERTAADAKAGAHAANVEICAADEHRIQQSEVGLRLVVFGVTDARVTAAGDTERTFREEVTLAAGAKTDRIIEVRPFEIDGVAVDALRQNDAGRDLRGYRQP